MGTVLNFYKKGDMICEDWVSPEGIFFFFGGNGDCMGSIDLYFSDWDQELEDQAREEFCEEEPEVPSPIAYAERAHYKVYNFTYDLVIEYEEGYVGYNEGEEPVILEEEGEWSELEFDLAETSDWDTY